MAGAERLICRRAQLVDGGLAVRFEMPHAGVNDAVAGFAIGFRGAVYAYVNSCPHRGTELDWQPGEVFEGTGLYLMCATHGALFDPASGLCVGGPCHGARLRALAIRVAGDDVVLLENEFDNASNRA